MTSVDEFAADFDEDPGYLDFARVGPVGHAVLEEEQALVELLRRARFGSLDSLGGQDERVRDAVSDVSGFRPDQIVFQPNTSTGMMHAMFGMSGVVGLSRAEFPSTTFAVVRAGESLGVLAPAWLDTDYGRLTPGALREQLTAEITAVAVSLVDYRTGYLADLEGIRQVIGDRLLIVDAIQGFGVVDAPYCLADVVVSGGQKWTRAGWGTGFLAVSDRAAAVLAPVLSGFAAAPEEQLLTGGVPPARRAASAMTISDPSPIAQARFATALERLSGVGVARVQERIAQGAARLIDLADEFAIPVVSPRDDAERAGIVVLQPAADRLTALSAALINHGISATVRGGTVRLSAHVTTTDETFDMLRASFTSFTSFGATLPG
jgi:selenocysteine lyase/cysteine desulfurase